MDIIDHPITIFTAQDANRFLQKYHHKSDSLESFLLNTDPTNLVTNLETQNIVIAQGDHLLFATKNDKEYNNTHICSPYNTYIGYGKLSAKNFERLWIRGFIYGFTLFFGKIFKWLQFNKVIQLNNTFSTINLHPENTDALLSPIIHKLIDAYPKHAIIWPRLNPELNKNLYNTLIQHHFKLIPTKTVHVYCSDKNYMKRSHTKRDLSLLKKSDYKIVNHHELTATDLVRIHALYEMLFIKKHAGYNPQLTLAYFESCHRHHWFEFTALRNPQGEIDAFISQAKRNGIMICGPLGYDTEKPIELGLYRMIIAVSLQNAHEADCTYNLGSGNELFKLNRGSERQLEYNAIYYHHLPFHRRLPWQILHWTGHHFIQRIVEKSLL